MKLKEIRQQYLIGLTELARRAGVSPQTILNIEQGKTKTQRMDITRKISQALGIPAPMIDEFTHLAGSN